VDEDIRVYDVSEVLENVTREGEASAKEIASVKGHFGEVSALKCWIKETESGKAPWVVSASLDGTLRRWSMKGSSAGSACVSVAD
jgi:hypothetical protein